MKLTIGKKGHLTVEDEGNFHIPVSQLIDNVL
jgi:hypothetical protein